MRRQQRERLSAIVFYGVLAILTVMLGWLSYRYHTQWDWSVNARNSLGDTSVQILKRLMAPVSLRSFTPKGSPLREKIRTLIRRYQDRSQWISFQFVDPEQEPELTRNLGIQVNGELIIEYQGGKETLRTLDESHISSAILRLLSRGERWIVSLEGHGDRSLEGMSNYDLGDFGNALSGLGFTLQTLNLANNPQIPENTRLLLITSPQAKPLTGELQAIRQYISRGGNLLWLTDPDTADDWKALLSMLELTQLPGTIVDMNAAALGLDNPAYAVVPNYPEHPAVSGSRQVTLYPYATALRMDESSNWIQTPVLQTLERAWNETGPIRGEVKPDTPEEHSGTQTIGVALEREINRRNQRILVIGDGDFLSNAFLGNGGNLDLGLNLVRWLSGDDDLLAISARIQTDPRLQLSTTQGAVIGFFFLVILPLTFIISGVIIWRVRRRR